MARSPDAVTVMFLAMAAACGKQATAPANDPPSPPGPMSGKWLGSGAGDSVTRGATLTETALGAGVGAVDGPGILSGPLASHGNLFVTISGKDSLNNVAFSIGVGGYLAATFTGTLYGDQVGGQLNGSGFNNLPITLQRQP